MRIGKWHIVAFVLCLVADDKMFKFGFLKYGFGHKCYNSIII